MTAFPNSRPHALIRLCAFRYILLCATVALALTACASNGPGEAVADTPLADEAMPRAKALNADGVQAFNAEDYDRARELLPSEAENGNAIAARYLGQIYLEGLGTERALQRAGEAFYRGAILGDAESQTRLAALFYQGRDFETNHEKARYWFRQAADNGHAEAQYALYNMLFQALGGKIRPASALGWAWLAQKNGYAGGEQAWGNRGLLVDDDTADRIKSALAGGKRPKRPQFDTQTSNRLRAPPDTGGSRNAPDAVSFQLRVGDKGVVRIEGVREMRSVIPGDDVMNPWIAYDVIEVTKIIKQVAPQLHGDIDMVKVSVMTQVAPDGSKKVRINTRTYRRE